MIIEPIDDPELREKLPEPLELLRLLESQDDGTARTVQVREKARELRAQIARILALRPALPLVVRTERRDALGEEWGIKCSPN